jgi:hypothetical protein
MRAWPDPPAPAARNARRGRAERTERIDDRADQPAAVGPAGGRIAGPGRQRHGPAKVVGDDPLLPRGRHGTGVATASNGREMHDEGEVGRCEQHHGIDVVVVDPQREVQRSGAVLGSGTAGEPDALARPHLRPGDDVDA